MIKHIKYIEKHIKENEVFFKNYKKIIIIKIKKDYGKEISNILMIERPFVQAHSKVWENHQNFQETSLQKCLEIGRENKTYQRVKISKYYVLAKFVTNWNCFENIQQFITFLVREFHKIKF